MNGETLNTGLCSLDTYGSRYLVICSIHFFKNCCTNAGLGLKLVFHLFLDHLGFKHFSKDLELDFSKMLNTQSIDFLMNFNHILKESYQAMSH
jgi:hypothetical protein